MEIFINQERHVFDKTFSLLELLNKLNIDSRGLAVAIDNKVIPKTQWDQQKIVDSQKLTLIRATQGG